MPDNAPVLVTEFQVAIHFIPAQLQYTINPQGIGRLLTLDLWVGETDRHQRNLLMVDDPDGFRITGIDFGAANLANLDEFQDQVDDFPDALWQVYAEMDYSFALEEAKDAAQRAASINDSTLKHILVESFSAVGEEGVDVRDTVNALKRRATQLEKVVERLLR